MHDLHEVCFDSSEYGIQIAREDRDIRLPSEICSVGVHLPTWNYLAVDLHATLRKWEPYPIARGVNPVYGKRKSAVDVPFLARRNGPLVIVLELF